MLVPHVADTWLPEHLVPYVHVWNNAEHFGAPMHAPAHRYLAALPSLFHAQWPKHGLLRVILQITLIGWIPAAIWTA